MAAWTHVVGVYDGSTAKLYLNGRLAGSTASSGTLENNNSDLTLGIDPENSGTYFSGKLDEARIYNRALSAQEVYSLYRYEAPGASWVSVEVESIRVTMHVRPARKYQLQASMNLTAWANLGDPFVPTSAEVVQSINAIESGRFFRLQEVP